MHVLKRRVLALESSQTHSGHAAVLTYAMAETAEDALRRAPGPGGYVVLAEVLSPEVWCALACEQQTALVASAADCRSQLLT